MGSWMDFFDSLLSFVRMHEALILTVLSALVVCLLFFSLYLFARARKLPRKGKSVSVTTADNLSDEMSEVIRRIDKFEKDIALITDRQRVSDQLLQGAIQKIGVVRFDAFPDVGGEQSFALALLDSNMNGFVISSLFGRSESRVYAKEITRGNSHHSLSDEEKDAIRRAGNHSG